MEFKEKGMPISRVEYCRGCIDGYHKKVAANIGMNLDGFGTKFTYTPAYASVAPHHL